MDGVDLDALTDTDENNLIDIVHDAADHLAATAHNAGDGMRFLREVCGWTDEQIRTEITERNPRRH